MSLSKELGRPLSVKEVSDLIGLDQRTVRKYAYELEGVFLAGRWRFFEKKIRRLINASIMQKTQRETLERKNSFQWQNTENEMVRLREERREGISKSSSMGREGKKKTVNKRRNSDPHHIFDD